MNKPEQAQPGQGSEPVAALRLRSERPPVMRLSRKVLTGLAGVAAITVSAALIWAGPSGRFLLIPQGSKLVGVYDSQISFGQDRVLLVWTRLIMPNGRSIVLVRQPGADTQGFTGLEDEVDQHWGRLAMAAALSTVLGVGAELGATNNDSAVVTALRRGTTDSLNPTGQQVVRRNLNIQVQFTHFFGVVNFGPTLPAAHLL